MKALRRVIVGTDFTAGALRAARRALRLPLAPRATVELMHAAPRVSSADFEAVVGRAGLAALERQAAGLRRGHTGPSPRIKSVLASGSPTEAVAREAEGMDVDLVVAGSHGSPGLPDLDIGSTAERLLAESETPVLIVKRSARHPYRHALVAMDLAGSSDRALALTLRLLGSAGGRVTLMHVVEPPIEAAIRMAGATAAERARMTERDREIADRILSGAANRIARAGFVAEYAVSGGDARSALLRAARRLRVDLVALGTRRASERTGLLLGSVARWVARRAGCDVLVARSTAGGEPREIVARGTGSREKQAMLDTAAIGS